MIMDPVNGVALINGLIYCLAGTVVLIIGILVWSRR